MYVPPAFNDEDFESIRATIHAARLGNLVTATADGPVATPLPLSTKKKVSTGFCMARHRQTSTLRFNRVHVRLRCVDPPGILAVHACGPVEFFQDSER